MEEGCLMGGFGLVVLEVFMDNNVFVFVLCLGVFDKLVDYVKFDELKVDLGLIFF